MKIAFLADVHVGNHKRFGGEVRSGINARANLCLNVLSSAVVRAGEVADYLFICGDLFDGVRPEPQIIAAVADVLHEGGIPIYLLRGNHEMVSTDAGDHSLGPLEVVPDVEGVIEEPTRIRLESVPDDRGKEVVEVFAVPFLPGSHATKLPGILKSLAVQGGQQGESPPASTPRLLALHSGISDDKTDLWLKNTPDSIPAGTLADLMHEHGVGLAFAGHWHKHRSWEFAMVPGGVESCKRIIQLGALCPTGWRDPGVEGYGTLAIWDSRKDADKATLLAVPGPRFLVGAGEVEAANKQGHKVFVKWPAISAEEEAGAQVVLASLKKRGAIVGGEVEQDRCDSEVAARTAASVARSADTLAEALAHYVEEMPLPEEVDRAAVLERAKRYLEGTA
jgi:hypothetical protein